MVNQPIRLICPDCDAVHRVKRITLGKLYRCKKCRTGLVTMQPVALHCPLCGVNTPAAHIEVSRLTTCQACGDSPLMEVLPPKVSSDRPREIKTMPLPEGDEKSKPDSIASSDSSRIILDIPQGPRTDTERKDLKQELLEKAEPVSSQEKMASEESSLVVAGNNLLPILGGQEERAMGALRQVFDNMQAPLIEEIENSRARVPWGVVAVMVVLFMGLIGFSMARSYRFENDAKSARAAYERLRKTDQERRDKFDNMLETLTKSFVQEHKDANKAEERAITKITTLERDCRNLSKANSIMSKDRKNFITISARYKDTIEILKDKNSKLERTIVALKKQLNGE